MTHEQIVAALQRDYQLDDARQSRRGCYPMRKPAPPAMPRRIGNHPLPSGTPLLEGRPPDGGSGEP